MTPVVGGTNAQTAILIGWRSTYYRPCFDFSKLNSSKRRHRITFTLMHLGRRFIQKRLKYIQAIHFSFIFQYMCSLGIEPTTFCAANAMLYHWSNPTAHCYLISIILFFFPFVIETLNDKQYLKVSAHWVRNFRMRFFIFVICDWHNVRSYYFSTCKFRAKISGLSVQWP